MERVLGERAFDFHEGEQVGQGLAGMTQVRQPVDDRDGGMVRPFLQRGLLERTDDESVEVPGQHEGRIAETFAPAELDGIRRQEQGLPAQLMHARLKGDPRAGRGFLEQQAQGQSREPLRSRTGPRGGLEFAGNAEQAEDLAAGNVGDSQQVFRAALRRRRRGRRNAGLRNGLSQECHTSVPNRLVCNIIFPVFMNAEAIRGVFAARRPTRPTSDRSRRWSRSGAVRTGGRCPRCS